MPDDAWPRVSRDVGGVERRASDLPLRRWQEVEVHRVDLGLGYGHRDWPEAFVARRLPSMLDQLAGRLPPGVTPPRVDGIPDHDLLAWLYDRLDLAGMPKLGAWG
jgi:maleylpyruvate isomerase